MLRQTGTFITTDDWVWMLDQMGQRPFYPPNVSGWEQNEAWLSTGSLRMRFQAAASLLQHAIKEGGVETLSYLIFDLLAVAGIDLTRCRLVDRKALLERPDYTPAGVAGSARVT